jgi:hypothetical protein
MIDLAMVPGKKTERAKCNMTVYIFIIPLLPDSCFEDMKKEPRHHAGGSCIMQSVYSHSLFESET